MQKLSEFIKKNMLVVLFNIIAIIFIIGWISSYLKGLKGEVVKFDELAPVGIALISLLVIDIKAIKGVDVTTLIFKELDSNKMYVNYHYLMEKYGLSLEKLDELIKKYASDTKLDANELVKYLERWVVVNGSKEINPK